MRAASAGTAACATRGLAAAILLALGGCAVNPVTRDVDFVTTTESGEVRQGRKAHEELIKEQGLYENEAINRYVDKVGQRLAAVSDRKDLKFYFNVIDSPDINAFALPGGWVYINRGLLAYLETEDQLAAVLGHEIGHITARHSVRQQSQARLGQVASIATGLLTGSGALMDVAGLTSAAMLSGYGREMELEADQIGGEYLARAGYDPNAMVEVIQILKEQEEFSTRVANAPKNYHGLFSTHPRNDKRLHEVIGQARQSAASEWREPEGDFLGVIDGMSWGNPAMDGLVRDNVYLHGQMAFVVEFAEGWRVVDSNTRVLGHPPGGQREAYVALQLRARDEQPSAEEFLKAAKDLGGATNVRKVETTEKLDAVVADLPTAGTEMQARMTAVVMRGEQVFVFKGEVRPGTHAAAFASQFEAAVASFRKLERADLKDANEHRLVVIEARPGTTYKDLAQDTTLEQFAEERLRLINGDWPNREPRAGDRIKVVR